MVAPLYMAKAFIPYQLDKVRNLRYGMVALSLIEEQSGKSLGSWDLNNVSIKDLGILLWAGLYHEDKDLTPLSVMELIDEYSDLEEAGTMVGKAIDAIQTKNKKAVVAKNGIGKN